MNRKKTRTAEMQIPDRAAAERPSTFAWEDAEGAAGKDEDGVTKTKEAFWLMVELPIVTTEDSEVVAEPVISVENGTATRFVGVGVSAAGVVLP